MPNKLAKKLILVAVIGLLALSPLTSFAQENRVALDKLTNNFGTFDIFCYGVALINWATIWIAFGISYVGGLLISLAGTIIQVVISAGNNVLTSPMVQTGFKIALDITNLGFVLAIILIAFTTMFRLQSYDTKQFLKNLIVAAVLVNFSLLIAGVVIDASNVFGNFFLNAASPGDITKFADNLAGALNIQKILGVTPNASDTYLVGSFVKAGASYFTTLASISAVVIFNTFLVITFYAIAIMLLLRYLWLVFLIIIMPLAWLAYTFPAFSKHFSEWWEKFLHWNIFYPLVTLFLYLGVQSSQAIGSLIAGTSGQGAAFNGNTLASAEKLTGLGVSTLAGFIQIFVQVAIMLGGLYAASRLKVVGAEAAMKLATGIQNRVLGVAKVATGVPAAGEFAKRRSAAAGTAAVSGIVSSKPWKSVAGGLSRVPGLKGLSVGMYNLAEAPKKAVDSTQKQIDDQKLSRDALIVKASTAVGPVEKAAYAAKLVEKDALEDFEKKYGKEQGDVLLRSAGDMGATKDILGKRVDLAPRLGKSIGDAVSKMTKKDIQAQSPEVFSDINVWKELDDELKAAIFEKGSRQARQNAAVASFKNKFANPDDESLVFVLQNPKARRTITGDIGINKLAEQLNVSEEKINELLATIKPAPKPKK